MRIVGSDPNQDPCPPAWSGKFIVPPNACRACLRHEHFRCVGGDPTLEPLQDCSCSCGHPRDPLRLSAQAWDDMARHVPWLIYVAVDKERLLAEGPHLMRRHEKRRPF